MRHVFAIHPDNPQARLLRKAAQIIQNNGVVVYPTDSGYALGCALGSKSALERIRRLRQLDKKHHMTLVCRDLSELGRYARVTTPLYRLLKANTPGAYTFILNASNEVPKLMLNPSRKTLGLRIPNNTVTHALLECLEGPLMSTSLILPGASASLSEPDAIRDVLGHHIDTLIDAGPCDLEPTTVIDLTADIPAIIRYGKGDPAPFEL